MLQTGTARYYYVGFVYYRLGLPGMAGLGFGCYRLGLPGIAGAGP
jgi:hypothetical protein